MCNYLYIHIKCKKNTIKGRFKRRKLVDLRFPLKEGVWGSSEAERSSPSYSSSVVSSLHILTASMFSVIGLNKLYMIASSLNLAV